MYVDSMLWMTYIEQMLSIDVELIELTGLLFEMAAVPWW